MQELYKLKEMLCEELKEYGSKKEMSAGSLEIVDKLSHTIKNLDKIIENYEEEEGYSGNYPDGMNYRGGSYRNDGRMYRNGTSYARNRRRDSMGRYSSADAKHDMVEQLRDMMRDAPDERMRMRIEQLIREFEM